MKPLPIKFLTSLHCPLLRTQWKQLIACPFAGSRYASSLSHLKEELTSRELPKIVDYSSPTPSRLLFTTLLDLFGDKKLDFAFLSKMLQGYHLVYFPPNTSLPSLLPDGTDPLHSPGPPFTRRMWAGGDITFLHDVLLKGREMKCCETISDVEIKGIEGEEKVFVTIQRNIDLLGKVRWKNCIIENRRFVFMRDRILTPNPPEVVTAKRQPVKSTHEADFSQVLTLSPSLLFRFSALTFNAHRIHLDQAYCQNVEGHRNLLVHGPLSLVLMLQLLHTQLMLKSQRKSEGLEKITNVEYRCLAPLYAEEQLKVCLREKDDNVWETWIEGPDGGLAVRGTVRTIAQPSQMKKSQKKKSQMEQS